MTLGQVIQKEWLSILIISLAMCLVGGATQIAVRATLEATKQEYYQYNLTASNK